MIVFHVAEYLGAAQANLATPVRWAFICPVGKAKIYRALSRLIGENPCCMDSDKFHKKAAELMDRALGEEILMRRFYEELARSYSRLGWHADRLAEKRKIEQEKQKQKQKIINGHEIGDRLRLLTLRHAMEAIAPDQIGGQQDSTDNLGDFGVSPPAEPK